MKAEELSFSMGGLFYADPKGVVTRYGENLTTNGVILSRDEKTLYVTNGGTNSLAVIRLRGHADEERDGDGEDGSRDEDGSRVVGSFPPAGTPPPSPPPARASSS